MDYNAANLFLVYGIKTRWPLRRAAKNWLVHAKLHAQDETIVAINVVVIAIERVASHCSPCILVDGPTDVNLKDIASIIPCSV